MISGEQIQQAVERLVAAANPSKVILFGSYARGDATEDSDLDLMVIEPQLKDKFGEMVRLRQALRPLRIPVDVLVYSRNYVDEWGHLPGTALYWALHEGKVLHGVAFRKTHDLDELVDLIIARHIPHPFEATTLSVMNPYAVLLRYEDIEFAGVAPAEADKIVVLVRRWAGEVVK